MEKAMPYKIGLSLSGGGARGIAHIGVIQALLEQGIEPEIVSGTSAGAIVGALYAAGCSVDEMRNFVEDSSFFKIFRLSGFRSGGIVKLTYLKEKLQKYIQNDSFKALKKPLYVCAANLNTGEGVLFHEGNLFEVVMASCAVPGIFAPVEINGQVYTDGGIVLNLPAEKIREQCKVLIGVNVRPNVAVSDNRQFQSFLGIADRVMELLLWNNVERHANLCDIFIAPAALKEFNSFDFTKSRGLIEIGYKATLEKMPEIIEKLKL